MEATNQHRDLAGVIAPPPVLFGIALVTSAALQTLAPLRLDNRRGPWHIGTGLALAAAGLSISTWMVIAFRRARTSVSPLHATTRLVSTGPYRFSRNPDYIGQTLLYAGLTVMLNTWWGFLILPPVLFTIDRAVVMREERYLEAKFGGEYARYKGRVRRWL